MVSAVNYTEVLIGPLEAARPDGAETVDAMLPDAYAVATAIDAEKLGHDDVRLESFDKKVIRAYQSLRR